MALIMELVVVTTLNKQKESKNRKVRGRITCLNQAKQENLF